MKIIVLIGRILFSLVFIVKSFEHFTGEKIQEAVANGVPMPQLLVPLAGVIALVGGLSILFGFKAKLGAWLLVIFLLPVSIYMHQFWTASSSFGEMMHSYCFWKNISMLGASLMITYFGAGPLSFDNKVK